MKATAMMKQKLNEGHWVRLRCGLKGVVIARNQHSIFVKDADGKVHRSFVGLVVEVLRDAKGV